MFLLCAVDVGRSAFEAEYTLRIRKSYRPFAGGRAKSAQTNTSQFLPNFISLQTRDSYLGMVQIDLAHVRIPHEQVGMPVTEASYILGAGGMHRSHPSFRGSVHLSLSYLSQPEQASSSQGSSGSDDSDWEHVNASSVAAYRQNQPSPLPEGI